MYSKKESEKEGKNGLKPDKTCHKSSNEGTMAKQATLPGQMYVPKKTSREDVFVGEQK